VFGSGSTGRAPDSTEMAEEIVATAIDVLDEPNR